MMDYALGINDTHILYYPHTVSLLWWDYERASLRTDYKAALTFIAYLYDQYGSQNLSDIYHLSDYQSTAAIMHIVNQYYPDLTFEQMYMNFMIANIVDTKYQGVHREYYYENFDAFPEPYRYPPAEIYQLDYPYDETTILYPWATNIYLFRNFPFIVLSEIYASRN